MQRTKTEQQNSEERLRPVGLFRFQRYSLSSPLLGYFMHCLSQVGNIPGCHTSDRNTSILGQIDREFLCESVNLRNGCNKSKQRALNKHYFNDKKHPRVDGGGGGGEGGRYFLQIWAGV